MTMTVFTEELKLANIGIFTPRKNQCDLCCEHKQGNCSDITYQGHSATKEATQIEKGQGCFLFCFFAQGPKLFA